MIGFRNTIMMPYESTTPLFCYTFVNLRLWLRTNASADELFLLINFHSYYSCTLIPWLRSLNRSLPPSPSSCDSGLLFIESSWYCDRSNDHFLYTSLRVTLFLHREVLPSQYRLVPDRTHNRSHFVTFVQSKLTPRELSREPLGVEQWKLPSMKNSWQKKWKFHFPQVQVVQQEKMSPEISILRVMFHFVHQERIENILERSSEVTAAFPGQWFI